MTIDEYNQIKTKIQEVTAEYARAEQVACLARFNYACWCDLKTEHDAMAAKYKRGGQTDSDMYAKLLQYRATIMKFVNCEEELKRAEGVAAVARVRLIQYEACLPHYKPEGAGLPKELP